MLPISFIITAILSTSALAATSVPQCTKPTHPPKGNEIGLSINVVNYMAVKWGHAQVNVKQADIPVYITAKGISADPEPNVHGAIRLTLIDPDVAMDFTFWDDMVDYAQMTFRSCVQRYGSDRLGGWIAIGYAKSLNLSFVDPHYPLGTNSSAGLPTVLKG